MALFLYINNFSLFIFITTPCQLLFFYRKLETLQKKLKKLFSSKSYLQQKKGFKQKLVNAIGKIKTPISRVKYPFSSTSKKLQIYQIFFGKLKK